MSDNLDQSTEQESPEARVKAAFLRLGVTLDDDSSGDTDTLVAALNGVADRLDASAGDLAAARSDLAKRDADLSSAQGEIAGLKRQVGAQKGQVTKARNAVVATVGRTLPEDPPIIAADDRDALLALLKAADKVEVVLFENDTEITAVPPLEVKGRDDAFTLGGDGIVLWGVPWKVQGPIDGTLIVTSWGLYADGELVAWRERPAGQLPIGSGNQFDLAYDVIF